MGSPQIPTRALSPPHPELQGINRSRIIGVAIDPAKTFHTILIFDFNLAVIEGPFSIDVLRSGLDQLLKAITQAKRLRAAKRVVIGLEVSGAYSWNLIRELGQRFEHVRLLNPLAVATGRKQKLLLGQKTDAIDVAVIGSLLLRGEGRSIRAAEPVFSELRERVYWRHQKIARVGELKQQLADRFEKVFPGLTLKANGTPALIANVNRSRFVVGLIREALTPQAVLRLSVPALRQWLQPHVGLGRRPSPQRVQTYLRNILFGPEPMAKTQLALLQRDFRLLQHLLEEIQAVEQEMVDLVKQTPGQWLLGQLKGLSDVQVASYIGALGDPRGFHSAKQIYSIAGLSPRQHESGKSIKNVGGIAKTGRQILRTLLFQMVQSVALYEPVFGNYRKRLQVQGKKRFRTAQIATANKLNKTLFALMRDQQPFRRGDAVLR